MTFKNLRDQLFGSKRLEHTTPTKRLSTQRAAPEPVPVDVCQPDPAPLDLLIMFAAQLVVTLAAAGIVFVFVTFILLYKEDIRDRFIRLSRPEKARR